MLRLELPHINVLSKIDMVNKYGNLDFNLDYYTEVQDLHYLQQFIKGSSTRYQKLNQVLCELVEDFSLVGFHTLNIEDKESVYNLLKVIDKSNGYIYGGLTSGNESIMNVAEKDLTWDISS